MTPLPSRPRLAPGATIAIVSPASPLPDETPDALAEGLRSCGFQVRFGRHALHRTRYLAGSDAQRADDLMTAFLDPEADAILAGRGGYGSPLLLDRLDYEAIAAHHKAFIGFSDITALQLALLTRAGLVSYSAVNLYPDLQATRTDARAVNTLWSMLRGETTTFDDLDTVQAGSCEGRIIGGCLSLLVSLLGTPYFPDPTGAILVLEDVKEEPYRVDRMLNQLRLAGVFRQAAGVVVGQFTECTARNPADGTVSDVLDEIPQWVTGPVVRGLDYGHVSRRLPLAVGAPAQMDARAERCRLTIR